MNTFAQFLFPENIFLDLHASNKMQVFAQIAARLERQHQLSRTMVYESLCVREELCSTGLGEGVAIPHGQIEDLQYPRAAFVRLDAAVDFNAPDGKPVSQLFILLLPVRTTNEHLQMLADVVGMLCDQDFRNTLSTASDTRAIQQCFQLDR